MISPGRCFVGTSGLNIILDIQLVAKIPIYPGIKLCPIVSHYRRWYSEPANDVFPYKSNNVFVFDGGEGFNVYPFSKIFCCYQ